MFLRVRTKALLSVLAPLSAATAQLSGGIGPAGQVASAASVWQKSAQLWGATRLENPWVSAQVEGSLVRTDRDLHFGRIAGTQHLFSPAVRGMRIVTSLDFDRGPASDARMSSMLSAATSLSYRRNLSGAWLGLGAERGAAQSIRMGGWRQLGDWITLAVSSTMRQGRFGRSPRFWTETYKDSLWSDSGWVFQNLDRTLGDSGSARTLRWLETEARMGWTIGRLSLDGVAGWRPALDTAKRAVWARGLATVAMARSVSLSAGVGTTMRQDPFARATGRYATLAIRLAPVALMRPRETPEITPSISSFRVEPEGDHYIVRIRLPRARVVELSGDFNGWQPIRLTQDLDNSWFAALDLKPGAYRMNVRVDGEQWAPPPGTAAVDDDFNGRVGVVIVR
jgi:hypothetical protein